MSAVSVLLLLNFPDMCLQKGFTPGEKPQHKISYWDIGTCIFIYILFILLIYLHIIYPPMSLSGTPVGPTFSLGLL